MSGMVDGKKYENKRILVTGGSGSIGSEIVRQLLKFNPKQIRVFDENENGCFKLQQELQESKKSKYVTFLIGDVRDKHRLLRAMENIDIVFHAAALKHVPLCEYNPFEAVSTNIVGTQNLIEAALNQNVEAVVNISTDKASHPTNVMGATKLVGEKLITAAECHKGDKRTIFSSVRFGNVVGSRGSVLEVFENQIRKGGPITVTHPEMTRYILSINEAVDLVLKSYEMMVGGEVFILKMPVFRLKDLAEILIDEFAPKYGFMPEDIKMDIIGLRPGEKMYEVLINEDELSNSVETNEFFILMPQIEMPHYSLLKEKYDGFSRPTISTFDSKNLEVLKKDELRSIIKEKILKERASLF